MRSAVCVCSGCSHQWAGTSSGQHDGDRHSRMTLRQIVHVAHECRNQRSVGTDDVPQANVREKWIARVVPAPGLTESSDLFARI